MSECEFLFDQSGCYRIAVGGRVSPTLKERLGGMSIEGYETSEGVKGTILTGPLADQSALVGVLDALYNLHLTILKVERT